MNDLIKGREELLPRVKRIIVCDGFKLLLTFTNDETREFDASFMLQFPACKDLDKVFKFAKVENGTVVWPGDIDICPDTIYIKSTPVIM